MKRGGSLPSAPESTRWLRLDYSMGGRSRPIGARRPICGSVIRPYGWTTSGDWCKTRPYYTSAGLTAGIDLALAVIEEDYGEQVARGVSRDLMLYLAPAAPPNEPTRRPEHESQPIDRFGDLVSWIMRHLHENLTVEVLARKAGMCPAHFTRAFKSVFGNTPGEFVENLRLNEARRRLSSRGKTVRSVAASVGFTNATAFRRAFERRFGAGPGACLKSREANLTTFPPDLAPSSKG